MKQTVVEWLIAQLENANVISRYAFPEVIQQAKAMEREQLEKAKHEGYIKAFDEVEKYLDKK